MVDIGTGFHQGEKHRLATGVAPARCRVSATLPLAPDVARHFQTSQQLDIARETADRRLRDAGALVGADKLRPQRFELRKRGDSVLRALAEVHGGFPLKTTLS